MMKQTRRKYDRAFKQKAVELAKARGNKQTVWYILTGFLLRSILPGKKILCNYLLTEPRSILSIV